MNDNQGKLLFPGTDTPTPTLAEARSDYRGNLRDGTVCPFCNRFGKISKR